MLVAREQIRLATAEERAAHEEIEGDARMTAQDLREDGGRTDYDDQAAEDPSHQDPLPQGVIPDPPDPPMPEVPVDPAAAQQELLDALARAAADRQE